MKRDARLNAVFFGGSLYVMPLTNQTLLSWLSTSGDSETSKRQDKYFFKFPSLTQSFGTKNRNTLICRSRTLIVWTIFRTFFGQFNGLFFGHFFYALETIVWML